MCNKLIVKVTGVSHCSKMTSEASQTVGSRGKQPVSPESVHLFLIICTNSII